MRYFASHGPAQLKDFAWWSGLTLRDTQRGLDLVASHLARETIDGKIHCFCPGSVAALSKAPAALLLSIYDEYTIAYRDRSAVGGERYIERLLGMGNALTSVIIFKGKIAGTWKRVFKKGEIEITANPFERLRKDQRQALGAAASRYGRFHQMPGILYCRDPTG